MGNSTRSGPSLLGVPNSSARAMQGGPVSAPCCQVPAAPDAAGVDGVDGPAERHRCATMWSSLNTTMRGAVREAGYPKFDCALSELPRTVKFLWPTSPGAAMRSETIEEV